jgi:hypothetical protein
MSSGYLFDNISDLNQKFKNFFCHKKKMHALDNYSNCAPFQHKDYLMLIKKCMADGFLGEREADFLCYMLDKYTLNYLDWAHKTKWLKEEMAKLAANYPKDEPKKAEQLPLFDYDRLKVTNAASVPFEMLAQRKQVRASA